MGCAATLGGDPGPASQPSCFVSDHKSRYTCSRCQSMRLRWVAQRPYKNLLGRMRYAVDVGHGPLQQFGRQAFTGPCTEQF